MESRWELAADGHFREREKPERILWNALKGEGPHSLDGYAECIKQLESDALIGPHLDRLVGAFSDCLVSQADHLPHFVHP